MSAEEGRAQARARRSAASGDSLGTLAGTLRDADLSADDLRRLLD